jgi:hypothetical protein
VTVTIGRLFQEKIDGKWRLIVEFPEGKDKHQLAINRTNGEAIGAMFGRDDPVRAWTGRRITLAEEQVRAFGETQPAIRVVGSPDISADVRVDVDLGRVKIQRTLRPTGNGARQRPKAPPIDPPPREPGSDDR